MLMLVFRGRKYRTLVEIAADYNISIDICFDIFWEEWEDEDIEEVLEDAKPIIYNNIRFECYSELADYFELGRDLVIYRAMMGWRLEDIINASELPVIEGILYKGVYYSNLDELVEKKK